MCRGLKDLQYARTLTLTLALASTLTFTLTAPLGEPGTAFRRHPQEDLR